MGSPWAPMVPARPHVKVCPEAIFEDTSERNGGSGIHTRIPQIPRIPRIPRIPGKWGNGVGSRSSDPPKHSQKSQDDVSSQANSRKGESAKATRIV